MKCCNARGAFLATKEVHHLLFMMKVLLCCCVDNWVKVVMTSSPSDKEHSTAAG
jgi:hypothetical protein